MLIIATVLLLIGAGFISYLILTDPVDIEAKRQAKKDAEKEKKKEAQSMLHNYISKASEKKDTAEGNSKKGFQIASDIDLEIAKISMTKEQILVYTLIAMFIGLCLMTILFNFMVGVFTALGVFMIVKKVIRAKVDGVRKKFRKQLEQALRVIGSSLSSGQSLNGAILSVAKDADEPMAGEMTRVVNEARIGRDLIEAFYECAERMDSEDFEWFASAAELQRATGGNLTEIIETVAETIRERGELREKIRAYAADGRASQAVLMGLPVVLGIVFGVMNPSYMAPLFTSLVGKIMLISCGILYFVAYTWMNKLINIKV